jgi:hypothetical protein
MGPGFRRGGDAMSRPYERLDATVAEGLIALREALTAPTEPDPPRRHKIHKPAL